MKRNILLGTFLIIAIMLTTVVYSAFSAQAQIKGEAIVRAKKNIRITDIKVVSQTNSAYETYNNKYNIDMTSMYVTLPPNSSITYEVTITNTANVRYDVTAITNESNTNNNITQTCSLNVNDIVGRNTTKTFTITLTNNTSEQQVGTLVKKYTFTEIQTKVVGTWDSPGIYEFTAPYTGTYKLEVWGAQGGSYDDKQGGYGSYSTGKLSLNQQNKLYVVIGGQGAKCQSGTCSGGYNGGGGSYEATGNDEGIGSTGGGATHIALVSGKLSEIGYTDAITNNKLIMVAGAGGGTGAGYSNTSNYGLGGSGGGIKGKNGWDSFVNSLGGDGYDGFVGTGATQSLGGKAIRSYRDLQVTTGTFGQGGTASDDCGTTPGSCSGSGGGGGLYGGGGSSRNHGGGGGGSGYVGYSTLEEAVMYCYDCEESDDAKTKTISTHGTTTHASERDTVNCSNGYSSDPVSKCARIGNGYAKITYIEN